MIYISNPNTNTDLDNFSLFRCRHKIMHQNTFYFHNMLNNIINGLLAPNSIIRMFRFHPLQKVV